MNNQQRTFIYENRDYLQGISDGNGFIIRSIFQEFLPGIEKHIMSNNGTQQDAEDIFMDALEVIFRKIKKENLVLSCQFYTYLFEICKRLWWKKLRRRNTAEKAALSIEKDIEYTNNITDQIEKAERSKLFQSKFKLLGKDCQQVLSMAINEDKDMNEIAKIMGYASSGYARKRKFKCKEKLIALIKGDTLYRELEIS